MDFPILVRGESVDREPFHEETFTVTVSAHGALLMMATKVAMGQSVTLMNAARNEREGRISYLGRDHAGLAQVGIEFLRPAPDFWPIDSPPSSWKSPS